MGIALGVSIEVCTKERKLDMKPGDRVAAKERKNGLVREAPGRAGVCPAKESLRRLTDPQ